MIHVEYFKDYNISYNLSIIFFCTILKKLLELNGCFCWKNKFMSLIINVVKHYNRHYPKFCVNKICPLGCSVEFSALHSTFAKCIAGFNRLTSYEELHFNLLISSQRSKETRLAGILLLCRRAFCHSISILFFH